MKQELSSGAQVHVIADLGASNGRVFIGAVTEGRARLQEIHRFANTPIKRQGRIYWNIHDLLDNITAGIRKVRAAGYEIRSLGIDGWACDCGFIDSGGKLADLPLSYLDEQRTEKAAALSEIITDEEIFGLTGGEISPVMTVYFLYQLKLTGAAEYKAEKMLMLPDLFSFFLTGEKRGEYTNLTSTLLIDQKKRNWSEELIEKIGMRRDLLPDIIPPMERYGRISKAASVTYDIPRTDLIAVSSWDTCSVLTGMPVKEKRGEWCYVSIGTWGVVGMETRSPVITDAVYRSGYANAGLPAGKNNLLKEFIGLFPLQQCRNAWNRFAGREFSWAEIVNEAEVSAPLSFVPDLREVQFFEPCDDMPERIREYFRRSGEAEPNSPGDTARGIFEFIVLLIVDGIEQLISLTGTEIDTVYVTGGGSKNRLLCQWIADASGLPVHVALEEAAVAGNLIVQAAGTGQIASVNEGRNIIAHSFIPKVFVPGNSRNWPKFTEHFG